ncbi:hypothetical protein K7432_015497 [Basidiobolus ranarum]|uniref:Uncharacterized protein n=1 Tax=Basidiobolus ranarum TaxID=34480 RepID=A0ABR2WG30_9FUNG
MYKNRSNPPSENVTIPATSAVSSTAITSSATQVVSSDAQQTSSPTASSAGTQPSSSAVPDVQAKGKSNPASVVRSSSAMALLTSAFAFWIHI